jgi:hypothetical protein
LSAETKNQWARDDPAFVALTIFFLIMATLSYAIAFHGWNWITILKLVLWSIFVEFLAVGLLVGTLGWYVDMCSSLLIHTYIILYSSLNKTNKSEQ